MKKRLRASVGFFFAAFLVLVDEALKEGYIFKVSDVWSPWITHEKIFLILFFAGFFLGLRR
ncbi:MAG: hypothetical protein QW544_02240 [Candidatus Caldarchaeum sp.]